MRASTFVRGRLSVATATVGMACSGSDGATAPGSATASRDAGPITCTATGCGAECCQDDVCWAVDSTGARVSQVPSCSWPPQGPPVGPTLAFAGHWSPISGGGEESCTDGESSALPPNPQAVFPMTSEGLFTLQVQGAGDASSCSLQLHVSGNVASPATPNEGCVIPNTNGVVVYYPTFNLTLIEPDAGAGAPDAGGTVEAGAGDAAGTPQETMTFQLASQYTDAVKTCTSSLVYTLVRVD